MVGCGCMCLVVDLDAVEIESGDADEKGVRVCFGVGGWSEGMGLASEIRMGNAIFEGRFLEMTAQNDCQKNAKSLLSNTL